MSEETATPAVEVPTVEIPVETPVVEVTVAPPAPPVEAPELVFEYQPTDESGRKLGGKQVLKYRTTDQLQQKLVEQNTLLIRKLREETRKNRLGISEVEEIPAEAPRFEEPVQFSPRALSKEERVKLSRDLLDPEKFDDASSALFEATMGAKPEILRHTLTQLGENNLRLLARSESDEWVRQTPGYYICNDNFKTLTNWMVKNNLAPVRENFQRAYDALTAAGLLLEAPTVREEAPIQSAAPSAEEVIEQTPANTQPVQATDGRITVEDPAQIKRPVVRIPSGLTRNQAADTGVTARSATNDDIVYELIRRDGQGRPTGEKKLYRGLAAVDAMPSDELKKRILSDKTFEKKYRQLLADKANQRSA